jgi:hypothetical protein
MAAVTICKTTVSEDLKRILYTRMLSIFKTPSQVNYQIGQEVDALNELSSSDRTAMCMEIELRVSLNRSTLNIGIVRTRHI